MTPRSDLVATAIVFVAAVAFHALLLAQYGDDPFATLYVADAAAYDRQAAAIVEDGLAAQPVFHQSPGFPLLLAGLYAVVAESARASWSAWLLLLLNAAAIAVLVPLGRLAFRSRAAGVAAAVLALLHAPLPYYGLKLLPLPLALVTQLASLTLLLAARRRESSRLAMAAGLAAGVACVVRAEMLLFVPVGIATLGTTRRRLLFAVAALAAIAPVTAHNVRQGAFVPIAASAGENLYIGNRPGAAGGYTPLAEGTGELVAQRDAARRIAERESGRALDAAEISAYWRGRTLAELEPGRWLRLELAKLARLLDPGDPTDIYSLALERREYLSALRVAAVGPWALLLLGAAGIAVARGTVRDWWPAAALGGVHLAVLLLFFVDARLRVPFYVVLALFAGAAVDAGLRAWRERRARGTVAMVAVLAVAGSLVTELALEPRPRDVVRLAAVLSRQDRLDDALAVLRETTARADADPVALDQEGWILQRQGRLEDAVERYRRALDGELPATRAVGTHARLAAVLERLGRFAEAAAQYDAAVAAEHGGPVNLYERALFRLRRGDASGAVADLRESARLAPDWTPPRRALERLGAPPTR